MALWCLPAGRGHEVALGDSDQRPADTRSHAQAPQMTTSPTMSRRSRPIRRTRSLSRIVAPRAHRREFADADRPGVPEMSTPNHRPTQHGWHRDCLARRPLSASPWLWPCAHRVRRPVRGCGQHRAPQRCAGQPRSLPRNLVDDPCSCFGGCANHGFLRPDSWCSSLGRGGRGVGRCRAVPAVGAGPAPTDPQCNDDGLTVRSPGMC